MTVTMVLIRSIYQKKIATLSCDNFRQTLDRHFKETESTELLPHQLSDIEMLLPGKQSSHGRTWSNPEELESLKWQTN